MSEVFVVNSGSSSIKYELLEPASGRRILGGLIERIGVAGSDVPDHMEGMRRVLAELGDGHDVVAVGHRVAHGGPRLTGPTLLDDETVAEIEALSALAPLHNPANVLGIRAARTAMPDVPHVAVFDTGFHRSLPPAAYRYAIDRDLAEKHLIRRYGFHGTSHEFVSREAARVLDRPLDEVKTIVLHLGNGASVTAVDGGLSVDTSMGLTPLEGLVMGTRSGDLDAGIVFHLVRQGMAPAEIESLLNRRSGLLGLTGKQDMRDVQAAALAGDQVADEAIELWAHRIRHYIGAYLAGLGGLDALVFTAGIGENNPGLRKRAVAGLGFLGIEVDDARNEAPSREARRISPDGAPVAVLVIPTDEELEIARQTLALVAHG